MDTASIPMPLDEAPKSVQFLTNQILCKRAFMKKSIARIKLHKKCCWSAVLPDDILDAVLDYVDLRTVIEVKCVTVFWRVVASNRERSLFGKNITPTHTHKQTHTHTHTKCGTSYTLIPTVTHTPNTHSFTETHSADTGVLSRRHMYTHKSNTFKSNAVTHTHTHTHTNTHNVNTNLPAFMLLHTHNWRKRTLYTACYAPPHIEECKRRRVAAH